MCNYGVSLLETSHPSSTISPCIPKDWLKEHWYCSCIREKACLTDVQTWCPWAIVLLLNVYSLVRAECDVLSEKRASVTCLLRLLSCRARHFWTGSYVDPWFAWKPSLSSSRRQWFTRRDYWWWEKCWPDQPLLKEWGGLSSYQQRAKDPERCGWRIQWFIQRGWYSAALPGLPETLAALGIPGAGQG